MTSIFKKVRAGLINNKLAREAGKNLVIPWTRFPKLSGVLPGVQRGRYYIVTSGPKGAKTQLTDTLFVLEPIDFLISNPDTNVELEIHYFSLEMSKEDKIKQLISNKIYKEKGVVISAENLDSLFNNYILDDELATLLFDVEYEKWFDFLEQHVNYIDHISNPTGIFMHMREVALKNGTFYWKGKALEIPPNAEWKNIKYDEYIPHNPDKFIVCITDHVGLLSEEAELKELRDLIHRYSSRYCIRMRDKFKMTVVNVHQQNLSSEQQIYNGGKPIIAKVKPMHSELGDSKTASRDCDLMIGLFNPYRFGIDVYPATKEANKSYDITDQLRDNYRELSILLNRRGGGNIELDLYFNGRVNYFEELQSPAMFSKLYLAGKTRLQFDEANINK